MLKMMIHLSEEAIFEATLNLATSQTFFVVHVVKISRFSYYKNLLEYFKSLFISLTFLLRRYEQKHFVQ